MWGTLHVPTQFLFYLFNSLYLCRPIYAYLLFVFLYVKCPLTPVPPPPTPHVPPPLAPLTPLVLVTPCMHQLVGI